MYVVQEETQKETQKETQAETRGTKAHKIAQNRTKTHG
ncbi:hypothetical protein F3D3_2372 [Fusibacter sp. 3D3]|nr:hypothetical protein F3D3_2372 [Fusibacter sp. 3D3]